MKSTFFLPVFVLSAATASFAQTGKATLKGHLQNSRTLTNMNNMKVTIFDLNVFTTSDGDGNFSISEVPFGKHTLVISGYGAKGDTLSVDVNNAVTDLANVAVTPDNKEVATENIEIPTITVEDNNNDDGSSSSSDGQTSSGFFVAGQDAYLNASSYSWGQYYFKARGLNNSEILVNGISTDDLEKGYSNYSQLSGFYDVTYNRDATYGLIPSPYTYGGTNGSVYVNATAADQRKGTSVVYSNTNRLYRNRATVTHSSGLMPSGWAYSLSATRRWANEGYIAGTYVDAYNFYASVSKVVRKGTFSLTAMASPTERGKNQTSTDEAYDLAGSNYYNPSWGYQNGEKRNSRVLNVFQPLFIANYEYNPTDHTRWTTSLGYEFGKSKNSFIDRYNAYSERGDYYRNLPSYYTESTSAEAGSAVRTQLLAHPEQLQLNWDNLYTSNYMNYETIHDVNGIAGNDITGKRSMYVLSNYVDDIKKLSFNTNIEHRINTHFTVDGALRFASQDNENYKQLADLLGGDFYLNYNQFADQHTLNNPSYSQNDLNHPNKIVRVGDKYAYDYIQSVKQGDGWAQIVYGNQKMDAFATGDLGYSSLTREGLMRNGLFPEHSYGKSEAHNFLTYKGKAGVAFKIDMRNILYVNADYTTEAPTVSNTYISASTRDFVVDDPTTIKYKTMEGGYILKSPILTGRISGYVTDVNDLTTVKRFYNDDPGTQSFISYVINKASVRSTGIEAAATLKINPEWSLSGAATYGQMFYTNNPTAGIYEDNDPTVAVKSHTVYIKNYYAGTGPQSAYNLTLNYTPARKWHVSASLNYFDRNYIEIFPERRTPASVDLVPPTQWGSIIDQEKLPAAYTVDLRGGTSFDLHRVVKSISSGRRIFVNAGINNLLNNTNFKIAGQEQLRYDFAARNPDKFANRYIYAQGINYYITLGLRF